jgi:hypothetical protein
MGIGVAWIDLPNIDFKGRNFVVIPSILNFSTIYTGTSGGDYTTIWNHYLETDVQILQYDYPNAKFKIRARQRVYALYRGVLQLQEYDPLTMSYYAFATT